LTQDIIFCASAHHSHKDNEIWFAYSGSEYHEGCSKILVCLHGKQMETTNGKLEYCDAGQFLAVSHVWDHGWQGVSEDGICSRVLDMLLNVAAEFKL
jgi:hypothetical protein